jgi:PBSX family phage terminase large subunit
MTAVKKIEITSEEMALAILSEVQRLKEAPVLSLVDENFPKQANFIKSRAKRKAALCTRRAGKSYGIGLDLYDTALNTPGCSVLYLALTRDSARNIMWKDVLKVINRDKGLNGRFNETLLTVTLPNGSVIYVAGADASKEEMEKYLGGKYALVVIDEAGSFRQDLRKLVYENLEPALADYDGTLVMIGTPTAFTKGLFFDITHPNSAKRELGWEVHTWNTFDNPYMKEKWKVRLDRLIEVTPGIVETPGFRRMYKGEWVTDLDDLVYKFNPDRNTCNILPDENYIYVLGIDLGFSPDPSAFAVAAYSLNDNVLYIIETYKQTQMIISDVAERIHYYQKKYNLQRLVIDNASKQAVEELKQRYKLPLVAADKAGKAEFIEIMNSEMIQGLIKVLPDAEGVSIEWLDLVWDERSEKRQEHPNCENHLSDAVLYAWRHCYQHLSEVSRETKDTPETAVEDWWDEEARRLEVKEKQFFWERE